MGRRHRPLVEVSLASIRARRNTWPAIILAVYLLTASAYALATPPGEAYDEWAHFAYIRYLVTERRLPASGQRLVPEMTWDETHQPPLYYLFGALATAGVDLSDNLRPATNPHLPDGYALNATIRGPEYRWPWRGSVLGMHLVRGVSLLMGALTVWLTYRLGRRLAPERPEVALGAMAIAALTPQFLFTSSIITNDIAVALFTTLSTLLLVRLAQAPTLRDLLWLIPALLAAILSKANGVALLPAATLIIAAVTLGPRRDLSWRQRLALLGAGLLLLGVAVSALQAWESWNAYLQGHHASVTVALRRYILPAIRGSGRPGLWHWGELPERLLYFYRTFWASFGQGNIELPHGYYVAMGLFTLLGLAGLALHGPRATRQARQGLAALAVVAFWTLAAPLYMMATSSSDHAAPGRYAMSLAPVLALVQALGLSELAPRIRGLAPRVRGLAPRVRGLAPRVRGLASRTPSAAVLGGYALLLLICAALIPWRVIWPAYAPGQRLDQAALQRVATPVDYRFGDTLALVGYRLPQASARPGDLVEVVLYWRVLAPPAHDYTVSVQLLDPDRVFFGGSDAYPARGNEGTRHWRPGEIIADRQYVRLGDDFAAPAYALIQVTLYRHGAHQHLPVTDAQGQAVAAAIFGRLRVAPADAPRHGRLFAARGPVQAVYGDAVVSDAVVLVDGDAFVGDGQAVIDTHWRALAPIAHDYTLFVHLLGPDGALLAQADGQPLGGRYPMTLWARGEEVRDRRTLAMPPGLPAGSYTLAVGLYRLDTLERLPAVDAAGRPLPDAELRLPIEWPAP
jgi:hypothetical protein